ncbi:related to polyketide synthase [Rhynchosporium agropyri]|uniref:Related to polyketide synthase n=1 Tax=Rhynchosporium agropyri TaxID=914238 RepID=A0A1E1L2J5_9HELO|nr:related to polyketide synthase [Rhynchosporium agropyri]
MAPSATSIFPASGGHAVPETTNGVSSGLFDGNENGHSHAPSAPNGGIAEPYTSGYTHGYTQGYISGLTEPERPKRMPIAIIGMSCRLPGNVSSPDEFWELCSRSRSGWTEVPKERFDSASFHHPNPGKRGTFNAAGGNFLKEDVGLFDAPFFSLTAQEATSMDPQQRILLECTFEALDSAGIPKHEIVGKNVGVFIGGSFAEYESQLFSDTEAIPMYQATGNAFAMQSNRLSHFFDLRGPSFTMDTACSSSLVALHQACQSLRIGESRIAFVGGCHLNTLPEFWVSMSMSRLFSDEGRSFSFDSRGTGYGRGEGCGMIVLKPLEQALRDNDTIRAVIVGSGINQDGKTPGITMPNGEAQESLIRSVYEGAGINPRETGYVEAHGTGTKVGDPIEAAALRNVFGEGRTARMPLFVGSVKSNIGHLEAASGIISVIKTALMLERGFILPNHDFKKPNEKIPLAKWNLKVPINQCPWPRGKRFASVNGFGFGGTNSHIILEKAPYLKKGELDVPETQDYTIQSRKLFVLSANDKPALEAMMKNVGIYLEQRPEIFQSELMSNVAYTLGQRRSLLQWRVAISTPTSFELIETLNSGKLTPTRQTESLRLGFIFTGQGAQWNAMGRELYEHYPIFQATMDACEECLVSFGASFSLLEELRKDEKTSAINEAHVSQPACTAIQLAMTDLLRSWCISPTAVAGHSSGEIAASYAAGILPLASCMAISYYRGMAIVSLKKQWPGLKGSMMAVGGTEEDIAPLIAQLMEKDVRIACFNSPSSLTISGDEAAIDELQTLIEEKQLFNRKLQVDVAYHSHHMKLVAEEYDETLDIIEQPSVTDVRFHSSLYGNLIEGTKLQPNYWVDNLTKSVRFSEALTSMCKPVEGYKTGVDMIIEIGPHSALAGPVKQILKANGPNAMAIPYASALIRKKDAVESAMDLAAALFVRGAPLDLGAVNFPRPRKAPLLLVDMPRYPWNHQTKYWHESRMSQKHKNRSAPRNDILGTLANYSNDLEPTWRNILRLDELPWLRHHKIQGLTLFPMSGFLSMAIEGASQRASTRGAQFDSFELREVFVTAPLMITDQDVETTIQFRPHQDGSEIWDKFLIHSYVYGKGWTEHCNGLISVRGDELSDFDHTRIVQDSKKLLQSTISKIQDSVSDSIDKDLMYSSLTDLGVSYGSTFQGMNNCQASTTCSMANITAEDTSQEMPLGFQSSNIIHPAFLEQLIEMYWPIFGAGKTSLDTVYLPSSIISMTVSRNITELTKTAGSSLRAFCEGEAPKTCPKPVQVSMFATSAGNLDTSVIRIDGLTIAPIVEREMASDNEAHRELCFKLEWEPVAKMPETVNGVTLESNEASNGASNGDLNHINGQVVIVHGDSKEQVLLASKLADALGLLTGQKPELGRLSEVKVDEKLCLFISELEKPLLSTLTSTQFLDLQSVLTKVQGALWVVRGAYADSNNPDTNMVTGLSRSIRSETLLKFATLDLDATSTLSDGGASRTILKIFQKVFNHESQANCEMEYMERHGELFTPRIVNDDEMNAYVHKQISASVLEPTGLAQDGRELKLAIGTPGALETLHFIDDESVEVILAADEIEISVRAIGMSSRDLMIAMGQIDNAEFGTEWSGVVTRVGEKVTSIIIGDRVAGVSVSHSTYSSHTRAKAAFTFKINDNLSFEDAVSIPIAYCTAHYGLLDLARLESGDRVLIHGAASPAGEAAIAIAIINGAEVFVTVGNQEEKERLMDLYKIRSDRIFSSHSTSFGPALRQVTQQGVDVVLNCIAADSGMSKELWQCLASFGRFVAVGKTSKFDNTCVDNNASFMSVDLLSILNERPIIMARLMSSVSRLLETGKISPVGSATVFPMSDIETAFKVLSSGNISSSLVVVPRDDDIVKATPSSKKSKLLRSDASYILIGGTGGLGRSMARWMVSKGARNLVLLSRTGSATGKVKELIDELTPLGANIVVRSCDVANAASVENLVNNELENMPPIRGIVHGAMVLHDVLFEKMTYEEYNTVIESKVKGAWNFHNTLSSSPLDFFVAISSAAGAVGNRGQAAYAAANTFLNAFVQHRVALGLPASSIDLTAVSDAGYLAENAEAAAEVAKNLGSDTICEAEVLTLLGAAINGKLKTSCNNHTITGVRITPSQPFWTPDAKFKHLRLAAEALALSNSSANPDAVISYHSALKEAKTLEEAHEVVQRGLLKKLPSVLMIEEEDMDVTRPLTSYALDSLVAIEVRNYITREFEANLQVLELLSAGSVESLSKVICGKSKIVKIVE